MALTDSTEAEVLQYLFGRVYFAPPPVYYAALSSTEINENGTGATEPSGGGYARVAIPNNATNFVLSGGQILNGTAIAFPTATGPWSQQNYIAFFDQSTGGTVKMRGSLSPAQTIDTNQRLFFDPNDLSLSAS